ncbi:hypothetical protein GUJ93_ZPchr0005g14679 [Zizania palustris]|uniref:Uncharacterized protein n=1 Tax=Zizania palustris TaxID=103762 RepID=A0A8J5SU23_ZIZPA|nr:hypothetical protein GUJ93_ZPchr0005g14679 [Zizania palustris]
MARGGGGGGANTDLGSRHKGGRRGGDDEGRDGEAGCYVLRAATVDLPRGDVHRADLPAAVDDAEGAVVGLRRRRTGFEPGEPGSSGRLDARGAGSSVTVAAEVVRVGPRVEACQVKAESAESGSG